MSILRRIFPFLLTAALLCACVQMPNTPQDVLPATTPQPTAAPTATPEASPTPTPEPTVAPAMATATSNATKDAPQIKDPTTWDDNAAKTLAGLKTQFAAYGLTLDAKEGCPYLLAVNNAGGVVTVYAVDSATKKYAVPFMAMVCSASSPQGSFRRSQCSRPPAFAAFPVCRYPRRRSAQAVPSAPRPPGSRSHNVPCFSPFVHFSSLPKAPSPRELALRSKD